MSVKDEVKAEQQRILNEKTEQRKADEVKPKKMKSKSNKIATLGILSIISVVVLVLVGIYIYKDMERKKIEKEVEQAVLDYESYLEEKEVDFSLEESIIESHNFLSEMEYRDEVRYEMSSYIHDEINRTMRVLFYPDSTTKDLKPTFDNPAKLKEVVEQNYVTAENKNNFETALAESNANQVFWDELKNMPKEELDKEVEANKKHIKIGASSSEVIERIGSPNDRTKSTDASGILEIWYYDDKVIYIRDGIVYRTVDM